MPPLLLRIVRASKYMFWRSEKLSVSQFSFQNPWAIRECFTPCLLSWQFYTTIRNVMHKSCINLSNNSRQRGISSIWHEKEPGGSFFLPNLQLLNTDVWITDFRKLFAPWQENPMPQNNSIRAWFDANKGLTIYICNFRLLTRLWSLTFPLNFVPVRQDAHSGYIEQGSNSLTVGKDKSTTACKRAELWQKLYALPSSAQLFWIR